MTDDDSRVDAKGLEFFGQVTASVSHEIKNTYAIINESAGLLEDYAAMAEKGAPIPLDRLRKLAGTIQLQVRRGDRIVREMNRFAHSADDPVRRVDVDELLDLVVSLSQRGAKSREVILESVRAPAPAVITTAPFVLENLLWQCLEHAMDAAGAGASLSASVEADGGGAVLRVVCSGGRSHPAVRVFPSEMESALARRLGATLHPGAGPGAWSVRLPVNIGTGR